MLVWFSNTDGSKAVKIILSSVVLTYAFKEFLLLKKSKPDK
jgi:hypothetical protein